MMWLIIPVAVMVSAIATLWLIGERGHLALPSTRAAWRGARAAAAERGGRSGHRRGILTALHGYVYGRWTEQYIRVARRLMPLMSPHAKQAWADRYHGKVLPTELACAIIRLDHDIKRTDLEHIIPYPTARDILLKGPPAVTLLECPCRLGKPDHCEPTQVCMLVGGDFTLDHHPTKARRTTQQEALDLLLAEHERGHVHTAYFKDACDSKFYAICNCCPCCCGGLEAMTKHGIPMIASSGFVAEVDEGSCIGCGDCERACPFGAVHVPYRAAVTWERCMGCGVCEGQCSTGAIQLVRDARKGEPLDVRAIA